MDREQSTTGGAWCSALSVAGFAAIGSVGFEPVGQVFGAAVSLEPDNVRILRAFYQRWESRPE